MTTPHARRQERAVRCAAVLSSLAACIVFAAAAGCGEDAGDDDLLLQPAYVIDIRPKPGGIVCGGSTVTVIFNRNPRVVESDAGRLHPAVQSGSTRTFYASGFWRMSFRWELDGALTVDYAPVICRYEPPRLIAATPDEHTSVTAQELEAHGIVLEFDQPVTPAAAGTRGAFRVVDSTGEEWRPTVTVDGARLTVQAPRSGVFVPGRAYDVTGWVFDAAGNATEIHLTYEAIDGDE